MTTLIQCPNCKKMSVCEFFMTSAMECTIKSCDYTYIDKHISLAGIAQVTKSPGKKNKTRISMEKKEEMKNDKGKIISLFKDKSTVQQLADKYKVSYHIMNHFKLKLIKDGDL